jgi:hypothetical protein
MKATCTRDDALVVVVITNKPRVCLSAQESGMANGQFGLTRDTTFPIILPV